MCLWQCNVPLAYLLVKFSRSVRFLLVHLLLSTSSSAVFSCEIRRLIFPSNCPCGVSMSLLYNMETFIIPRGLFMMQTGSLTFQKTRNILTPNTYTMEFVLLVALLLTAIIAYLYTGTKKNVNVKPAPKITPKPKSKWCLKVYFWAVGHTGITWDYSDGQICAFVKPDLSAGF